MLNEDIKTTITIELDRSVLSVIANVIEACKVFHASRASWFFSHQSKFNSSYIAHAKCTVRLQRRENVKSNVKTSVNR